MHIHDKIPNNVFVSADKIHMYWNPVDVSIVLKNYVLRGLNDWICSIWSISV